jgi:hypothetical protein
VLLLKVDKELLDDNDEVQIRNHLESWKVANVLRESKELGIFVGNGGVKTFRLFG